MLLALLPRAAGLDPLHAGVLVAALGIGLLAGPARPWAWALLTVGLWAAFPAIPVCALPAAAALTRPTPADLLGLAAGILLAGFDLPRTVPVVALALLAVGLAPGPGRGTGRP